MTLTLVVPGPPVAFARTRIAIGQGRAIRPFTPRPQRKAKNKPPDLTAGEFNRGE